MGVLQSLLSVPFLFGTPERHSKAKTFTSWAQVLKISQDTSVTKYILESLKNHNLKYINATINLTSEIPQGSEIIIQAPTFRRSL